MIENGNILGLIFFFSNRELWKRMATSWVQHGERCDSQEALVGTRETVFSHRHVRQFRRNRLVVLDHFSQRCRRYVPATAIKLLLIQIDCCCRLQRLRLSWSMLVPFGSEPTTDEPRHCAEHRQPNELGQRRSALLRAQPTSVPVTSLLRRQRQCHPQAVRRHGGRQLRLFVNVVHLFHVQTSHSSCFHIDLIGICFNA